MTPAIHQIIRSHRRSIALIITRDGQLVVRAPWWATRREIESLVAQKQGWITKKLHHIEKKQDVHTLNPFSDGELFWYKGIRYPLVLSQTDRTVLLKDHHLHFPARFLNHPERAMVRWYAHEALRFIAERADHYARRYGLPYTGITITGARTRWGSCSHSNRLCFSWRLILLSEELIDYVVVHELCHTVEKNHSHAFWEKVETIMPDYKARRTLLKEL